MWSRRSEAEIAAFERKQKRWYSRFNPIPALVFPFAVAVVFFLHDVSGYAGSRSGDRLTPLPLADAAVRFLICFVCFFLIIFSVQVLGGRHVRWSTAVRTVICPRCRRTQTYFGEDFCGCGARFEPIEHWYWKDDDTFAPGT
jgi:hypothetical protein